MIVQIVHTKQGCNTKFTFPSYSPVVDYSFMYEYIKFLVKQELVTGTEHCKVNKLLSRFNEWNTVAPIKGKTGKLKLSHITILYKIDARNIRNKS